MAPKWQGIVFNATGEDDTLDYCQFRGIKVLNRSGAVVVTNARPTIRNCIFNDNYTLTGGTIYLNNTDLLLYNCTFYSNYGASNGALFLQNSGALIDRCYFYNNTLETGGIIQIDGRQQYSDGSMLSPRISNTMIYQHHMVNGNLLQVTNSNPQLINVTIADNESSGNGGVFSISDNGQIFIENSILWNNTALFSNNSTIKRNNSAVICRYSDIDLSALTYLPIIDLDGTVILQNPLFSDNYKLKKNSPCIDLGNPYYPVGEELFPHGYRINMGAYGGTASAAGTESRQLTLVPNTINFGHLHPGEGKSQTLYIKNGSPYDITILSITCDDSLHFRISGNHTTILKSAAIDSIQVSLINSKTIEPVFTKSLLIKTANGEVREIAITGSTESRSILRHTISGVLKKEGSPYYTTTDLTIAPGETLTVEAGVSINFSAGTGIYFERKSRLSANGLPGDSIYFNFPGTEKANCGFYFDNSQTNNEMSYCVISGGNFISAPVCLLNSNLTIKHSAVYNNHSFNQGFRLSERSGAACCCD